MKKGVFIRRFAMVGSVLLALAMAAMALGAVSASAVEWLCGGVANSKCKTDGVNLSVLLLEDAGAASAAVECPVETVTSTGTVGAGATDETLTATFAEGGTKCTPAAKAFNLEDKEVANACTKVDAVTAINLPWTTTLEEDAEGKWDLLSKGPGAAGQPGYLTECVTLLGLIDDVCTINAASTPLVWVENLTETGVAKLVTVLFLRDLLANAEYANCTVGGTNEGLVVGEVLIEGLTEAGVTQAVEVG
jgi:hypothetical protein